MCNTGLERALGADKSLAHAVALLAKTPLRVDLKEGFAAPK